MGTLYLVATPIGNLEDISARAVRILRQARLIAAEDTRHTHKLLAHYQISTRVTSYYEHNKLGKLAEIMTALAEGDVALVSDAGTPALNDPGYELVRAVLQAGHRVSPIPGASAPIAALVASGLPTDAFLYLGYLPRKTSERRRFIQEVAQSRYTLIFLEAPHRLNETLQDLKELLGNRPVAVARELTKLHEEIVRGSLEEALAHFTAQPARGEFTLVVGGLIDKTEPWSEEQVLAAIAANLAAEPAPTQLASRLAELSGWPRRVIYQWILKYNPEQ
jgi:16S rRNA (cytidine1402-2'-O)-methyltransferase